MMSRISMGFLRPSWMIRPPSLRVIVYLLSWYSTVPALVSWVFPSCCSPASKVEDWFDGDDAGSLLPLATSCDTLGSAVALLAAEAILLAVGAASLDVGATLLAGGVALAAERRTTEDE